MEELKLVISTTPEVMYAVIWLLLYFLWKSHGRNKNSNIQR